MRNEIDFEKDYLILYRDTTEKISHFDWYSVEKASKEKIDALITKWNETQKEKGETGRHAELVTDPFIRELCAYKERARPLLELMSDAKEIKEDVEQAEEYLESALEKIKRIRGLDLE